MESAAWVWILTLTLTSCVALGKQFIPACFLSNKSNVRKKKKEKKCKDIHLMALLGGLKELMHQEHTAQAGI